MAQGALTRHNCQFAYDVNRPKVATPDVRDGLSRARGPSSRDRSLSRNALYLRLALRADLKKPNFQTSIIAAPDCFRRLTYNGG